MTTKKFTHSARNQSTLQIPHTCYSFNPSNLLIQQSPTFLVPGSDSVEENFSKDWGWGDGFGMIQAHYIHCALYF